MPELVHITSISLVNFRNHGKKSFEFSPKITLIVGSNGAGKTNILEAIYCLATGESWRTETAKEMIRFDAEVAHVIGHVQENGGDVGLHLTLTGGTVAGKRSAAVLYKVDEVPRRRIDFVGRLKTVLFEPESLEIVIGEPGERRGFLDEVLTPTDREYLRSLMVYSKALRIRNRLLDAIRDGKANLESLEYWERAMVKHGQEVQNKRRELIDWMNKRFSLIKEDDPPSPRLRRASRRLGLKLILEYQPNPISFERLEKYREREVEAGHTFVGPQRDELWVMGCESRSEGEGRPNHQRLLALFGSRGEQRMAVLQLKLLEAEWIEEKTGQSPVVLLDDIFSELDEEHEKMAGELVSGRQAIITATEIHQGHYPKAEVIHLNIKA